MSMKICCASGCDDLALPGKPHCDEHATEALARANARRAKAKLGAAAQAGAAFYATPRWRRESKLFLFRHPFCADCGELGVDVLASEVDHIIPHRGDARLMWDRSNWQSLCKCCHSRKTAREVFGSVKSSDAAPQR
ncbi:HNH endonuclease signature motif containing protein [Paracoccus aestuariivivens]|uniref:Putative HNH nuclease YajD n=1 Tax=Paracoccus aestuariivivens TaxID=1820333 RepID=A0A6L6J517_9RHOB|nr:HNH endonuclease signature motif containing protein [Paracoccus aestuariivivens]MTH76325.1 HNH endonuclease [Paracoccus aestuariivivens]